MNLHPVFEGQDSPARLLLRLPLTDKVLTTELSEDFTLPDYLPEIRKMLRVSADILPAESYVGGDRIEFSGGIRYNALYTGADGQLWSAPLSAEYAFSAPLEAPPNCDLTLGVDAFTDSAPELLVTRVTSPRKLTVRCRMRSHVRAYAWHSLEEKLSGNPLGKIERLTGETDAALLLRATSDEVLLSDEILPDTQSSASRGHQRLICTDGSVFVTETSTDKDLVHVRGEVVLKLMTTLESAEPDDNNTDITPKITLRKIPFTKSIFVEGADRFCECRAFGHILSINASTEEGRILCDITLKLTAECQKNRRFSYTRDIFSTGAEVEPTYTATTVPFALRCGNGNFTLSDSALLSECGITAAERIIDCTGEVSADDVSAENGRYRFSGKAHFHLLTENPDTHEYGAGECTLPFRYDSEGGSDTPIAEIPTPTDFSCTAEPISIRLRSDGERLSIDAEIAISTRTAGELSISVLSAADFQSRLSRPAGSILLYYPVSGEKLWDAAKKYHVTPDALAESNSLDPAPDTPLDGVRFLVVG